MPEAATIDHSIIPQTSINQPDLRADSSIVSAQDLLESTEILTLPQKQYQEAESLTHGMIMYKAKEVMPLLPKPGESLNVEKLPDWAKKLDEESRSNTIQALSYLQGIRNLPEGVYDGDSSKRDVSMFKMSVMYNTDSESADLVLRDGQEEEDGQTKLTLTEFKGRKGDKITFGSDYSQYDITLSVDEFTKLFSFAKQEDLLKVFEGKTLKVAQEYFEHIDTPNDFAVDKATMNEAVRNSGRISTEALIQSLPPIDVAGDAEAQKQIEAKNKKREQLINKLQNHAIATAQDMADVMSFHTPDQIQKTIVEYKQSITGQLDTLGQLRNQRMVAEEQGDSAQLAKIDEQMKAAQDEINSLRAKINEQTKAEAFFKDPKNLVDFFSMADAGQISPEMGKQINDMLSQGNMSEALMKMAEAKIATLDEKTKEKIREQLGLSKGQEMTFAAVGGAALIFLMILMSAMKQG